MSKYKHWQRELSIYWARGLHWQEFIKRQLPGDGWTVEWISGGATLHVPGEPTLQEFCSIVQAVTAALGRPPDKTKSDTSWGTPSMSASWDKVEPGHRVHAGKESGHPGKVTVACMAKGCRLIEVLDHEKVVPPSPVEQRIQIMKRVLHPECAHVLEGLTS